MSGINLNPFSKKNKEESSTAETTKTGEAKKEDKKET